MNHERAETGSTPFLTVDAILAEHEALLAAQSAREDVSQIRAFVDKLAASGAYFDEAVERKAIQGTLDYWTSELARQQTDEETTGLRRRSIREFDAEALKALQHKFENPFAQIADAIDSLGPEERHSAPAILKRVDEIAKASNLRFQEGLLKELASQVTGDREDATLLEFCLWHLFEDPETRWGNKIYRPRRTRNKDQRVEFFSCKVFLVTKAGQLYEALPDRERDALIGALMSMTANDADAQRSSSALRSITAKLDELSGALSTASQAHQFVLYEDRPLTLTEFLARSRLAFREADKWAIVHPVLAERWDPLKKRKWEAEEKAKSRQRTLLASFTIVVVALVTSLAWIAWYVYWGDAAAEHLAQAQTLRKPSERLSEGVAGLWASKLSMGGDDAYARLVANDAIGAVIGQRAKQRTLGQPNAYPSFPGIECERTGGGGNPDSYTVTITSDFEDPAKVSGMDSCPVFAVNLSGTLLAAAWEKINGDVDVKVFALPLPPERFRLRGERSGALAGPDLKEVGAAWMRALTPVKLTPLLHGEPSDRGTKGCKDRSLRFSADDAVVSFECLYESENPSGSALEWIPYAVGQKKREGASSAPVSNVSEGSFEAIRKIVAAEKAASVFLGPRNEANPGFATVRGNGYVRIWHDGKDRPSAEFRSDFVRVGTSGRPTALDVEDADDHPIYAIYSLSPYPVIRIYDQRRARHATLLMEHYPPSGVGTPVSIEFTPEARCLKVRAKRVVKESGELDLVVYYLILDTDRLLTVANALERDLEIKAPGSGLPAYEKAIKEQCEA
jgi:hypothetical protein